MEHRGDTVETFSDKDLLDAIPEVIPVVPTMDTVVFPQMIVPLLVVDEKIINGVDQAINSNKLILLLGTKLISEDQEAIGTKDLYSIGTVCSIMRVVKIPNGGIKILVQGICKARVKNLDADSDALIANISKISRVILECKPVYYTFE